MSDPHWETTTAHSITTERTMALKQNAFSPKPESSEITVRCRVENRDWKTVKSKRIIGFLLRDRSSNNTIVSIYASDGDETPTGTKSLG